jgi:hypothetical protein
MKEERRERSSGSARNDLTYYTKNKVKNPFCICPAFNTHCCKRNTIDERRVHVSAA